jgi:phage baseplate assembly protein W
MPGENLLDPEFGCALKYFLFSPMTNDNANNIGEAISQAITKYEPRVNIEFIDVIMDKNKYTYEITLTVGIPSLSISSERFNVRASEAGGVEI